MGCILSTPCFIQPVTRHNNKALCYNIMMIVFTQTDGNDIENVGAISV